jgi:hypothetical protein
MGLFTSWLPTRPYGLDPKSGRVVKKFPGLTDQVPGVAPGAGYCGEAAPSFFGNSAIFGASTQGITIPKFSRRGVSENYYEASARGFVGSLDLEKGKLNWMWFSVPPAKKWPKKWHAQARRQHPALPGRLGQVRAHRRGRAVGDRRGRRAGTTRLFRHRQLRPLRLRRPGRARAQPVHGLLGLP